MNNHDVCRYLELMEAYPSHNTLVDAAESLEAKGNT